MAEPNLDDLLAQFQNEIKQVEERLPAVENYDDEAAAAAAKRARVEGEEKTEVEEPPRPRVVSAVVAAAKPEPVTSISITLPAERPPEPERERPQQSHYEYKGNNQVYVDPATLPHSYYGPGGPSGRRPGTGAGAGAGAGVGTGGAATVAVATQPVAAAQQAQAAPAQPTQHKKFVRAAGGEVWEDDTLNEWPENDFRLFVGDLGNEVTTEMLAREFSCYSSFQKAKVIRDKHNNKTKGYGFVSFLDPLEAARALREKNGRYLGHRPMKIRKSEWKERNIQEVKKKEKKKRKLEKALGLA